MSENKTFPTDGLVRAKESAKFLRIGLSTFWKYTKAGQIEKPKKLGSRTSVWSAQYIRGLAENGIPAPAKEGGK